MSRRLKNRLSSVLPKNKCTALLVLILGLGAILYLAGTGWGLTAGDVPPSPEPVSSTHPNEGSYVNAAIHASNLEFDQMGHTFWTKPSNLLIVMLTGLFFIPSQLHWFPDASGYYVLARFAVAVLAVLTLWLTYRTSVEVFGSKRMALLPAFVMSVMMLFVYEAHTAWMNVPATFFGALSLFFAARLLNLSEAGEDRKGEVRLNLILSCVALGIGTSLKYQIVFLVFPLIVSVFYLDRARWSKIKMLLGAASAVILAFFLTNPYWLFNPVRGLESVSGTASHYSTGHGGIIPTEGLTWVDTYTNIFTVLQWWIGIPLAVLFVLALINSIIRHRKTDVFLLAGTIPFYAFFGQYIFTFGRHLIPTLVPISILIAKLVYDTAEILGSSVGSSFRRKSLAVGRGLFILGIAVCFLYSLLYSVAFVSLFRDWEEDTRLEAAEWIEISVAEGASIGVDEIESRKWMIPKLDQERYEIVKEYNSIPDYIVITSPRFKVMEDYLDHKEMYRAEDWSPYDPPSQAREEFYTKLFEETSYRLIADFKREPDILCFEIDTSEAPYHIWAITHPEIRIYINRDYEMTLSSSH